MKDKETQQPQTTYTIKPTVIPPYEMYHHHDDSDDEHILKHAMEEQKHILHHIKEQQKPHMVPLH